MPSADEINAVLEEMPPEAVTAATAADPLYDAVSSSTPKVTRLGPAPAAKPAALHASVRKGQARASAASARGKKPASAKRAAAAPAKRAKAKAAGAAHAAAPKASRAAAKPKHSGKPAASQAKAAPAKKKQERKAKR